jgi:hypothetical protein
MIIEIIKIGINNMKNNPCIILLILIAHNGLQIFDVADLEALNLQFTTNVY